MTSLHQIDRLLPVLEAAFQAQQARMAQIARRIETYKNQLEELDRPTSQSNGLESPAVRAGADLRWRKWAEDRKAKINREMAMVRRDQEALRAELRQAFGRLEAARTLRKRTAFEARRLTERRSSL